MTGMLHIALKSIELADQLSIHALKSRAIRITNRKFYKHVPPFTAKSESFFQRSAC
jgi:hypothetical protein